MSKSSVERALWTAEQLSYERTNQPKRPRQTQIGQTDMTEQNREKLTNAQSSSSSPLSYSCSFSFFLFFFLFWFFPCLFASRSRYMGRMEGFYICVSDTGQGRSSSSPNKPSNSPQPFQSPATRRQLPGEPDAHAGSHWQQQWQKHVRRGGQSDRTAELTAIDIHAEPRGRREMKGWRRSGAKG